MKTEICHFSGLKVYPGHGTRFVRGDSKTFIFFNKKSKVQFLNKTNPRKVPWTAVYRRLRKKGIVEEASKKKARKTQKLQRAIVGASLELIQAKRNQKPEVRQAARDAALKAIKEKKKAKLQTKVKETPKAAAANKKAPVQKPKVKPAAKQSKAVSKGAGNKGR
eukprot:TRINITY_DN2771_c0_g2_i1.p1 TRINITY_DN2771_c0_g2~~TRINITY_DN2771_c0_g2_i1.p1  ORF type:complete len:164 (-),score=44.23 TRINITY_DN2771_c0_g2_i1:121-612(-)